MKCHGIYHFNQAPFVFVSETHIQIKISIKKYKSQSKRPYSNEEFLRSLARTRGVQINTKYAEAFQVMVDFLK